MVKIALTNPQPRGSKDVASPGAVQEIWDAAAEAVRKEAPVVQRRRRRSAARRK